MTKQRIQAQVCWAFSSALHGLGKHLIQVYGGTIPGGEKATHDLAVPKISYFKGPGNNDADSTTRSHKTLTFFYDNPATNPNKHSLLSPFYGYRI